ncbi:hypothetical protein F511_28688 [Dorcoceras hygrometricum]|uniref:Splicing factor 3B subunit 1-like n=1 Tax=Dorcoceras hygrometricum TaxID=472368 RepID=A0A2Z7A4X3_9LAMI|nr:hypothetical protein F511_28688 [Dorcoceras hygrometricum]
MASSLFTNTLHVYFDYVLAMDNPGMVSMFEAIMASSLSGFLGCPAVLYEDALIEFFVNGSVRNGKVVSAIRGKQVEISEELFASTFELPVDGLTDLSEIPKDILFDARSIFSFSGEQRPAAVDEPIVKKKRTRVVKAGAVATDSSLEAVPIQAVSPISIVPPLARKRKIQKRRIRLALDSDDEIVGEPTTVTVEVPVENIVEEQRVEMSIDPVDQIIEQVIGETAQELAAREANRPFETTSDTENEFVTEKESATDVGVQIETGLDFYLVETPSEQTELFQGTETETAAKNILDDESMTLEEILLTIPVDFPLPSTFGEITKIHLGQYISIPGVDDGDWYKASLPKINPADKGKAPLQEQDPVKENPVKEQFSLIVADIALIVLLREQVIDGLDPLFNSFSLKNLANLKIEDIYEKEEQVLSWAETDSTRIALQRKMYILTKYRELLIRNFLEAHRLNFVPGNGSTDTDLKVLDMLYNPHLFVIDELKELTQAHMLRWEKPCFSTVFEGPIRDRGAVIARSNTNIKSTSWIRTMLRVNGTWVLEPCADYWKKIPRVFAFSIVVIPSRLSYVDTLPPASESFKLLKKRWADACLEDIEFFVSGKLLPVGSLNFCRAIAVVPPLSVFGFQRPMVTYWGWSQLCIAFLRYGLFSGLITVDIRNFVSTCSEQIVLRDVQLVTHSVSVAPSVHTSIASVFAPDVHLLDIDRNGVSSDSSTDSPADSSLHFNANDISSEDDAALDQSILPSSATDISASLAALRESLSKHVANQTRDSRKSTFRGLFKSIRQEAQNDNNALSLALKAVRTQNAILSTNLAATQKEVKDLKVALSKDFDDKLDDIRNDILEFRVETQAQLASLGAHLAELIAFVTKGSDDKNGEGSSSRPQPPPDDQNRSSGGSGSRADDPSRSGGDTISREGANRGGDGRRRGDSSGSSKRRHSDSGVGSGGRINYGPYLPPKRDAEYWSSGKRQF